VVAKLQALADQDLDTLSDAARANRLMTFRGLVDRLDGHWLAWLAAVDARGAAGAEDGVQAGSTAGWLRRRLRMSAGAATSCVRTARALFRGPLAGTGQALAGGELSPAHARVLADSTQELPAPVAVEAEPVLVEVARRLDRPGCGGRWPICGWSPIPRGPTPRPNAATSSAACGCRRPGRAWSPSKACWTPRPARPSSRH
jgi:Domain of unknown function (DUF222)